MRVLGEEINLGLQIIVDTFLENKRVRVYTVASNAPASVSISASVNPVCSGASVTFTATPTNGGTTPTYQWKLNGTNVGTNSTTYTNATLANGDKITCVMTSNASCGTGNLVTSNVVTMTVNALPTISGNSNVCVGSTITLAGSATPATTNPWTSASTGVATVSSSGVVTGVSAGTSVITYTNSNGCSVTTTVTVNALPTISGNSNVCVGSTTALTGSATPATTNPWTSASTGVATVSSSGVVTGVSAGTSVITYTNSNGCTVTKTITVDGLPTVTITTSPIIANNCGDATLTASATPMTSNAILLNEDFNSATNSWTKINNSTGGTPANAAWKLRPDGYQYNYGGGYPVRTFRSNDNSQFYLSNSAEQGNATTATILQSPVMNSVGYSSLSLEFFQYNLDYDDSDFARVEVSTNGSTWTTINTTTTTQGAENNFLRTTLNLDNYINQATLYIRFKYDAQFDWFWAIDNVKVIGMPITYNYNYSWSAAPAATAGLPAGAGTPSVSNTKIDVKPSQTTTYTVTATNIATGCSATSTVTINVSPATPILNPKTITCAATSFTADWAAVANATGYQLDVATDAAFANFVTGYNNRPLGNVTSDAVTGLLPGTIYYVRLRAVNSCGASANSAVLAVSAPVKTWNAGWNQSGAPSTPPTMQRLLFLLLIIL